VVVYENTIPISRFADDQPRTADNMLSMARIVQDPQSAFELEEIMTIDARAGVENWL